MKSDFEQTVDKNFDKALSLCSKSYSNSDLIKFLKEGNLPEKQFAALEISELKTEDDAKIFISNLINCDGKIREAVAHKFTHFVENMKYREYFSNFPEIFAKSTIDINANISRMVIDGLFLMKEYSVFGEKYSALLINFINEAFRELDKIIYKDKKYTINKQLFKLYWCLEGLNNYSQYVDKNILFEILKRTLNESEYTVREKAAQIIIKFKTKKFQELAEQIKSDKNYYVRKMCKR